MRSNKSWLLFLIALTSCFHSAQDTFVVQGPSPKKQKQKIAVLQKKLETAEKEQQKAQTEVEKLATEINQVQLSLIRRQVDDYEKLKNKPHKMFLEERETLYQMIQGGPSPSAFEAQVELDRILRIITESSDEGKNV